MELWAAEGSVDVILGQEHQISGYPIPVDPSTFTSNYQEPHKIQANDIDGIPRWNWKDAERIYDYSDITDKSVSLYFDQPVPITADLPRSFNITHLEFTLFWADTLEPIDNSATEANSEQCPTIASLICT